VTRLNWRAVWRIGLNPSCPAESIPFSSIKSDSMVWTTMVYVLARVLARAMGR
jgi:hypothetical protein